MSHNLLVLLAAVRVHGVTFSSAGFVNDALEEAANGGVGERPLVVAFGILEDLFFAVGLIKRKALFLFQFADFQRTLGTLVEKLDQLTVEFVDAAAEIGKTGHAATARTERREI